MSAGEGGVGGASDGAAWPGWLKAWVMIVVGSVTAFALPFGVLWTLAALWDIIKWTIPGGVSGA